MSAQKLHVTICVRPMAEATNDYPLHIGKKMGNRPRGEAFFVAHRVAGIHYDKTLRIGQTFTGNAAEV